MSISIGPLNLGRDELVTINELVDTIADVAGKEITKDHDLSKPQGVRGRNSDNSRLEKLLDWSPGISLREGIARTYPWIFEEMAEQGEAEPPEPRPVDEVVAETTVSA